jgi:hypothetical protein
MALQLFKEMFDGKYDGVTPVTSLPAGWISDGRNMRKVSPRGGWKPRKGFVLHNTTQLASGAAVQSLHQYVHPRNSDSHFLVQANSNLYDATNDPPAVGTTFGSSVYAAASTTSGFSDVVGEHWFYGDGGSLVTWGGDTPYPIGFLAWDNSETSYVDYTREVTDANTATLGYILGAANDAVYVCSPEIAEGITFDISNPNSNSVTATLYSWVAGAWADRTVTDGTLATGKTLAVDGSMTWARNSSDTMSVIAGIMGYWYKITFSGALSGTVTVNSVKLSFDATAMTNKWDGIPQWPTGVRFYDQSSGEYVDYLGKVTNESTSLYIDLASATTSDYIYIKTPEPATGFGFGIPDGQENDGAGSNVDLIEYWDGDSWNSVITDGVTALTDETLDGAGAISFAATGWIWFNGAALSPKRRKLTWDPVPGYWYRVSWDAAMGTAARIYTIVYAPMPIALPSYDGCVQFKDRLFVWGDPEYPNRLRYSAKGKPDCFCGADSGYTDAFGDMSKVVCAKRFYNELAVFKKNSVWLLEGNSPETFGKVEIADTVGAASPKTVQVSEAGYPSMHSNEVLSILLWQDTDGVYVLDGRKPKKVSLPVDQYFNPESSSCISTTNIVLLQAFMDRTNCEYHLLIPGSVELVYNYVTDEWYPPFSRGLIPTTGICLRGTDNRYYTFGAVTGWILKLETDTSDKNASNEDVAITHYVKTRGICAKQDQAATFVFTFRELWAEIKARSAGTVVVNSYQDGATSGTSQASPTAMSMINSGYNFAYPYLSISDSGCMMMQLYFGAATIDWEVEIYSFLYSLEVQGLSI